MKVFSAAGGNGGRSSLQFEVADSLFEISDASLRRTALWSVSSIPLADRRLVVLGIASESIER